MEPAAREVLETSTAWMDELWDDDVGLLWNVRREYHLVRETSLYALGLLQRAAGGDEARAHLAIDRVLAFQYKKPGAPYHGTFRRAPEEADAPDDPAMWIHYDPNWRQFIGTTLAVIVDRFGTPSSQLERVLHAIELAATSEDPKRVAPTYANIALMKAWLDRWVGERTNDHERIETGDAMARAVAAHFDEHGSFLEYNSPTYYGIDLLALALWRQADGVMAELGPRLESALWNDIARFYHAGMRNMCGPFDRIYGMDMTRYATPLGLCIWAAIDRGHAPFPDTSGRFRHPHDLAFGPAVVAHGHGPHVPPEARPALHAFGGERTIERTITSDPLRRATAWLGTDAMCGAQVGPASGIGLFQHAHATMHWRMSGAHSLGGGPGGRSAPGQESERDVGWARLRPDVAADAIATPQQLDIEAHTTAPVTFEIYSPDAPLMEINAWQLGGRTIEVATNATALRVTREGDRYLASFEPVGRGATTFVLRL